VWRGQVGKESVQVTTFAQFGLYVEETPLLPALVHSHQMPHAIAIVGLITTTVITVTVAITVCVIAVNEASHEHHFIQHPLSITDVSERFVRLLDRERSVINAARDTPHRTERALGR
jgi:hypothetical protein